MLEPGIQYDPATHPPESAPQRDQIALNEPDSRIRRRHANDGTPYCACCDLTLHPHRGQGPGRPNATCTECGEARRQFSKDGYEERQRNQLKLATSRDAPYGDLSQADVQQLTDFIDNLTVAVGRSSSHFKAHDQGSWQHALLLAAKDLVVWREQCIPSEPN